MKNIKACIVGTGGIARQHVSGLREHSDRIELVAVQDVNASAAAAFAAEFAVPAVYTELAALLAREKPDLVHICTPPSVHSALAIQCMQAGAHVLCEKPLCASLAELAMIQEAELRTSRFCASVFQMRYGSSAQHVRSVIGANELGRPLVAACHTLWYRDVAYYQVPWRGKWTNEFGGPTVGHGIHAMDQLLFLLGDWKNVRAVARTRDRAIEVEDVSAAIVEFANGCVATVINSVISPRQETFLRLDLQDATIELTHLYQYNNKSWRFTAAPTADPAAFVWLCALPPDKPATHGAQIAALLENIRLGTVPLTAGAEARNTIELVTAIYKSSFTGEVVVRGSITANDPFYGSFHGGQGASMRVA